MTRPFALLLAASLSVGTLAAATAARAEPIPTDSVVSEPTQPTERERVKQFFERDDVRGKIQSLGVAPELAFKRVDSLTDAEVHALAARIDKLPAGGDIGKNTLILILVILLLVVLI